MSLRTLTPATLLSLTWQGVSCHLLVLLIRAPHPGMFFTSPLLKSSSSFKIYHTCLPLQEVFLDHPMGTNCSHSTVGWEKRKRMEKLYAGHPGRFGRFDKEMLQRGVGDLGRRERAPWEMILWVITWCPMSFFELKQDKTGISIQLL